jgi:hypothetical protein
MFLHQGASGRYLRFLVVLLSSLSNVCSTSSLTNVLFVGLRGAGSTGMYPKFCLYSSAEDVKAKLRDGVPHTIRMKVRAVQIAHSIAAFQPVRLLNACSVAVRVGCIVNTQSLKTMVALTCVSLLVVSAVFAMSCAQRLCVSVCFGFSVVEK